MTSTTDENNKTTSFTYDDAGRQTGITDANNHTTTTAYNACGLVASVTDARSNAVSYTHNSRHRLTRVTFPDSSYEEYGYDSLGNRTSKRTQKADVIAYEYNNRNRPTKIDYPSGTDTTFSYDDKGQRTEMVDSVGTTTYTWDAAGRLSSVSDPFGKTISYSHDGNSNLSGFTDQFAGTVSLAYDSVNRVSSLTDRNSNQTSYTYNDDGLVSRINLPNGAYTTHSYNNRDFTTQVAHRKSDDSLIDSFSYTYDSVGNPTALTENNGGSVSFSYDNVNQLSGDTRTGNNAYNITYEYDAVGNRSRMVKDGNTTNYTYDNMNRMTQAGSTTFGYDANGNTASKTEGSDTTTYEYDYENRMTRIVYPGGGTTETFAYNGDGVRLSRTDSSGTTRFFWKKGPVSYAQGIGMDDLTFEADASNQMTAAYHYGNDLVGMTRGTSNYWYHYDNLGTTRLVTDSSQATAASYVYDAFGNIRSQTGSLTNPYDYVGELGYFTDPGPSGLLSLRARYYRPDYGRFWSADLLRGLAPRREATQPPDRHHLYVYGASRPLVEADPSGLSSYQWPGYWVNERCGVVVGTPDRYLDRSLRRLEKRDLYEPPVVSWEDLIANSRCVYQCRLKFTIPDETNAGILSYEMREPPVATGVPPHLVWVYYASCLKPPGGLVGGYPAWSGLKGARPSDQCRQNIGPIPEGAYGIVRSYGRGKWQIFSPYAGFALAGKCGLQLNPQWFKVCRAPGARGGFWIHGKGFSEFETHGCIELSDANLEDFMILTEMHCLTITRLSVDYGALGRTHPRTRR